MTVGLSERAPTRPRFEWQVDTLTRADGLAQVERNEDGVRVVVADLAPGSASSAGSEETTEAWLYGDGRVLVRSNIAPPALLVTESGARLLPAAPEVECSSDTSDGDLLVLCSAEALGHLPTGMGGVLSCSPLRMGAHEPAALLQKLMAGSEFGAALIARCRANGGPASGRLPNVPAQEASSPPRRGGES